MEEETRRDGEMKRSSFSVQIDPDLLAQFDALVGRNGDNRNQLIRNLVTGYVAENTAAVAGWIRIARPGETSTAECAGCEQQLDFESGVFAPLMTTNEVVHNALHCAGCAIHE